MTRTANRSETFNVTGKPNSSEGTAQNLKDNPAIVPDIGTATCAVSLNSNPGPLIVPAVSGLLSEPELQNKDSTLSAPGLDSWVAQGLNLLRIIQ